MFERYIGIDYSGAKTPQSSLKTLRVYGNDRLTDPSEIPPTPSSRKYWTRRGIADWLRDELSKVKPTIVGIDHGFSFPLRYFETHGLPLDWPKFLDDFHRYWPTDGDNISVESIRNRLHGDGSQRTGDHRWLRLTERWTPTAKSVLRFDVRGSVAKSTYAGLPWLRFLREHCGNRVHFWPFDGWEIPAERSVVAEVYPTLWMRRFPTDNRNSDQHAAYSVASWLRHTDVNNNMPRYFAPNLDPGDLRTAKIEGWILGVV